MTIKELFQHIYKDAKRHYSRERGLLSLWLRPSFRLILNYRLGNFFRLNGHHLTADYLHHRQVRNYACCISYESKLGDNIKFPHPTGIVIGEGAIVGDNVRIWQSVTLGSHGKPGQPQTYPVIGDGVRIYAHAQVLGGITIGSEAIIGANSVVLKDVPARAVAVGSPAVILDRPHKD